MGHVVCIPVTPEGLVGHSWGKAPTVAVAKVSEGEIVDWEIHDVAWDVSHDAGPHGSHHGRLVRFLQDHDVTDVVAGHVGEPMQNTLAKLGVGVHLGAQGDARRACIDAAG
ncbi:MAG: hypothetical protein GC156_00970 [Actinomycetales bacterium]|nr:hypothetical protein [Actinomycetales bacterium]